jgi:hypothetical protein
MAIANAYSIFPLNLDGYGVLSPLLLSKMLRFVGGLVMTKLTTTLS